MLSKMLSRTKQPKPSEPNKKHLDKEAENKNKTKKEDPAPIEKTEIVIPQYVDENTRIVKINDVNIMVDDSVDPKRTNVAYSSELFEKYMKRAGINMKDPKMQSTVVTLFLKNKAVLTDLKKTIVGYY